MNFILYAIYNKEADKIYIGQTENLERRLSEHNSHAFPHSFTSRFSGQWVLIYQEQAQDRSMALRREKALKSFRGREFVKKYIPR